MYLNRYMSLTTLPYHHQHVSPPQHPTHHPTHSPSRINVSIRIRRAIHLKDLSLLKRIIKNNPQSLQNPDFTDNGNTSLHLAAQLGLLDIAEFLIDAGHENDGISRNANWDTPLHLAVETSEPVAQLLAAHFPRCIPWKNKQGADAIMLCARTSHTPLIPLLLSLSPPLGGPFSPSLIGRPGSLDPTSPLHATDNAGNTPLHYASAYGQLKNIRTLLEHGADAGARNAWSWTPVAYSASVQAEVYMRDLKSSQERGIGAPGMDREGGRSRGGSGGKGGGGLRLVGREREEEWDPREEVGRRSGDSAGRMRGDSGGRVRGDSGGVTAPGRARGDSGGRMRAGSGE